MAKRANGEGYIYKKKNHYEARITKGYDKNGNQLFKYFSSKTRTELIAKLDKYKAEKLNGTYIEDKKITVGQWLDEFYNTHVVNRVTLSTQVNDESIIKHHLKPFIGRIKLSELKGRSVQQMYNQMLIDGRVDGKGGLNPKTVRNIHITLHKALEQAVKDDLIIKNPLKSVTLPRMKKKEIQILTPEEQKKLNHACLEHPWGIAILLTLYSGMRKGEVLGLTWNNIDFDNRKLYVTQQLTRIKDYRKDATAKTMLGIIDDTKTKTSKRIIYIAPVIMEELKKHKEKQSREKLKWSYEYKDFNMVFCREDGHYIDPGTFRDFYLRTLKKAQIAPKTFHALRHTFATRALEINSNIKTVSEILGHASIQITLDTYSHVSKDLQEETMQKMIDSFYL